MNQKAKARQAVQAKLDHIDSRTYLQMQQPIYRSASRLLRETTGIKRVLLYRPFTQWREADLSQLEDDFKTISFSYAPTIKGAALPSTTFDVIFVPLYGFNSNGYRLGHGGGWYDRLLGKQTNALKIGVGFEVCKVNFTVEPHDIPMDLIVTESQVRRLTIRS